ncbi:MAG: hypothetical protein V2B18_18685 [Pseudomonadota bacterium]
MGTLDCEKAHQWLIEDMDQGLDEDVRRSLRNHLDLCRACRRAEEEYRYLWKYIADDVPPDPGEAFWEDYRSSLNKKLEEIRRRRSLSWYFQLSSWKRAAVFASALAALTAVLVGWNEEKLTYPPPDQAICRDLVRELNEIYGPTAEEGLPGTYVDRAGIVLSASKNVVPSYGIPTWFEVEDEPSPPYF